MLITKTQNAQLHKLLNDANEVAWKQDYVAEASNHRVYSSQELTVDEAAVAISWLMEVKRGERAPKNPMTPPVPPAKGSGFETEAELCNRLRRLILKYCHDMKWYIPGTMKLDFERIDNYCLKHGVVRKRFNQYDARDLMGNGGVVYQFKQMAKNYTK